MSKKDYELIAKVLYKRRKDIEKTTWSTDYVKCTVKAFHEGTVMEIVESLASANVRFNKSKFFQASGVNYA